jgi:hypothetical protein
MEEQLDTTDPFLQLLTDALRAGPGSPEWHQAVARINAGEKGPDDEYAMLVRARENLASGKAYREVKPGVGFTRKVLQSINNDAPSNRNKGPFSASLISYIGAGLVVATLALILFKMTDHPSGGEDLSDQVFVSTHLSASLEGTLPSGWKLIGPLPVDPTKGLLPTITKKSADYVGGGIVSTEGISPAAPFAVEATFDFKQPSDDCIPQLFVTDDPTFSEDKGVSPHELVWLVQGGAAQVALPDGKLKASKKLVEGQSIEVRIVVGATSALVLCDGVELWSGPSQLAADKPRYVGVRLLCRKKNENAIVMVKQLRVMTK